MLISPFKPLDCFNNHPPVCVKGGLIAAVRRSPDVEMTPRSRRFPGGEDPSFLHSNQSLNPGVLRERWSGWGGGDRSFLGGKA